MTGMAIDAWWKGMIAVGAVILGAGVFGRDQGAVALGIGFVLLGLGEWINHPRREGMIGDGLERYKIVSTARRPSLFGTVFSIAGGGLLLAGVARLAIALFK